MPPLPNLIALIVLLCLGGYLVWRWLALNGRSPAQLRLLKTGLAAEATIVDVIATDSYHDRKTVREVVVVLRVAPPDGDAYLVRTRRSAPASGQGPYAVGLSLPVRIDRKDPQRIALVGIDG